MENTDRVLKSYCFESGTTTFFSGLPIVKVGINFELHLLL